MPLEAAMRHCVRLFMKTARVGTIFLSPIIFLSACSPDCQNEIIESHPSPDGAKKAVVFQRGCGATVGFNTQVSILAAEADTPDKANVLVMNGKVPLRIQWKSDSSISISELPSKEIFKQETEAEGVQITYE